MKRYIKAKYLCRPASASNAVIKNQAAKKPLEGYYPAYSASGQDVWLPNYEFDTDAIVLSAVGARCGKTFVAHGKFGLCANTHTLIVDTNKVYINYLQYIFNNEDWWKKGGSAQPFVLVNDSLNQKIYYPMMDEQARIANFLDKKVSEIDAVISKTEKTIEEYKKYVLSRIDFLLSEKKNETYSYYKLGHIGNLKNGLNFKNSGGKPIKFLGVGDFKEHIIIDSCKQFSEVYIDNPPEDYLLKNGDIVFVRSNGSKELVGRSVMVDNVDYPLIYSGFCIRFRNNSFSKVNNHYLLYYFRSLRFRELLRIGSGGTNINNLNQELLNSIRIPIPSMQKQNEIVSTLNKLSNDVEKLIDRKKQIIDELEQYKKSLIYEYVTGKKELIK